MRILCILCDQAYQPDKKQQKKMIKYPHLIQICPNCAAKITNQIITKKCQSVSND